MDEEEYCAANRALSRQVIEALDPIGVDRLFIASSGAARHADDDGAPHDLRLYGRLKKDDEERFAAWALARPDRRRAAICRIFSLTGPYINKHDTYALASFILDALAGRAIDVRAPIPVQRSYVALRELISLVLVLLIDGCEPVLRFDSGGTPMELGDVAARVASVLGATKVNRASITGTGENVYVGDADAYLALLADAGIEPVPFDDQIAETAAYISSTAVQ
jgi:nucleoside-diphosphate-sugar epimerase